MPVPLRVAMPANMACPLISTKVDRLVREKGALRSGLFGGHAKDGIEKAVVHCKGMCWTKEKVWE